jgi:hypothetical protein
MARLELDRRRIERMPRLSAQLSCPGAGQTGFGLSVWLESPEPLAALRVVVREARNRDCPLGFDRGQRGVARQLPPALEAEGILPAWEKDTLHPLADWADRLAPGAAAFWIMELRRSTDQSAGADGIRFKALARAERDDQCWELPLPVSVTDKARAAIDQVAASSGR